MSAGSQFWQLKTELIVYHSFRIMKEEYDTKFMKYKTRLLVEFKKKLNVLTKIKTKTAE